MSHTSQFTISVDRFPSLNGRVVVATGAATGIGASLTRLLVFHGAHVFFGDTNTDAGTKLERELSSAMGGSATFFQTDVQKYDEMYALFRQAYNRHGRVDHAVYSAGLLGLGRYFADASLIVDTVGQDPGDLSTLDFNLIGAVRFTRLTVVFLQAKEDGLDKPITLLSSIGAIRDSSGVPLYQTSKVGVLGLLRGLRTLPWAIPRGSVLNPKVRVNIGCPGVTDTPMTAHLVSQVKAAAGRAHCQSLEAVAEIIAGVLVGGRLNGQDYVFWLERVYTWKEGWPSRLRKGW
ncbi:hypothetical protein CSAL01_08913 [Colletotrichum salicis]|uniref:Uncharacterized protein n=1 Tax=Colletotrichum salicis TaxID=1209931 RepID=A0A135V224_9PEZI|nr:hypothetical protein CSAL01_08913 [Colletotrichum salicis]